jgi:hypothetical protein
MEALTCTASVYMAGHLQIAEPAPRAILLDDRDEMEKEKSLVYIS